MMPGASGPMRGMRGNVRGRGGRGGKLLKIYLCTNFKIIVNIYLGFLPQSGYAPGAPGFGYGGKRFS